MHTTSSNLRTTLTPNSTTIFFAKLQSIMRLCSQTNKNNEEAKLH